MDVYGSNVRVSVVLSNYQMYVPGQLKDTDSVMVDIGTGYFAEKVSGVERVYHNIVSVPSGNYRLEPGSNRAPASYCEPGLMLRKLQCYIVN